MIRFICYDLGKSRYLDFSPFRCPQAIILRIMAGALLPLAGLGYFNVFQSFSTHRLADLLHIVSSSTQIAFAAVLFNGRNAAYASLALVFAVARRQRPIPRRVAASSSILVSKDFHYIGLSLFKRTRAYIYNVTGSWRRDAALVGLRSGSARSGGVWDINSNDNTSPATSRDGLRALAALCESPGTLPLTSHPLRPAPTSRYLPGSQNPKIMIF